MDVTHVIPDGIEQYGYCKSKIVDHTLDDARLGARCPLDYGRHHGQPTRRVGRLDVLPLELITQILLGLDLPSLISFRRVNRRAAVLVDSVHEYRMVYNHCPDIIRAIVSVDAKHFNLRTLFGTLSTTRCASCHRFGDYLYLITCKRVCYLCFTTDILYFPVPATVAAKYTGLPRGRLTCLPHVRSLPGHYTERGKLSRRRITLFDRQSIQTRASDMSQPLDEIRPRADLTTREPRRYMSIIPAPYFTSDRRSAHWGLFCNSCIDSKSPETNFRIKYTEEEFKRHMARYGIDHGGKC